MNSTIRILIVDDHPFFRQGVRFFLETVSDFSVLGEADTGEEGMRLMKALENESSLPVVLMDLQMPGLSGIETIWQMRERWTDLRILVLTSSEEDDAVRKAMKAGAAGYCLKDAPPEELVMAIRAVWGGGTYLGKGVDVGWETGKQEGQEKNDLENQPGRVAETLTRREKDVLRLLAKGFSNREIAETLFVSEKTVKTHVANIFGKISVNSRTQAAIWANEHIQ